MADYLSRLQEEAIQLDVELKPTSPTVATITLADLARSSSQDEQLTQVSAALQTGKWTEFNLDIPSDTAAFNSVRKELEALEP